VSATSPLPRKRRHPLKGEYGLSACRLSTRELQARVLDGRRGDYLPVLRSALERRWNKLTAELRGLAKEIRYQAGGRRESTTADLCMFPQIGFGKFLENRGNPMPFERRAYRQRSRCRSQARSSLRFISVTVNGKGLSCSGRRGDITGIKAAGRDGGCAGALPLRW